MTAHRDLKQIIRARQDKTGESYTTARAHVMRARSERVGPSTEAPARLDVARRFEAVVLKVNRQSARVRILGEAGQLTFRSSDAWSVVPGHVATLLVEKRWTWKGDAYASGRIEDPRIDVTKLGLVPLPVDGGERVDLRSAYEPHRRPDPYAPLWRKLTAKPRAAFEMDPIAWGAFPGSDPEDDPTSDAAELSDAGDVEGARELLMDTLLRDLRCIDAHSHLGNLEFERSPKRAIVHYEVGDRSQAHGSGKRRTPSLACLADVDVSRGRKRAVTYLASQLFPHFDATDVRAYSSRSMRTARARQDGFVGRRIFIRASRARMRSG